MSATETGNPFAVLVVAEDARVRLSLCDAVRESGARPIQASTVEEGARLLAQEPHLVFLQANLSGQGSPWLCQQLRLSANLFDLPVVAVAGRDRREAVRRCFVSGADDWAPEPISRPLVLAKMAAVREASRDRPASEREQRTVLLFAGQAFFAEMIRRLLQNSGHEVFHLAEREQFVACLASDRPAHLAIVDVDHRRECSRELLKASRARAGGPVEVAAVGSSGERPWAADLGIDALFHPQNDFERLVKHVHASLKGSAIQLERRAKPRIAFHAPVHFRFYGDTEWLSGFGYDLSETGLFVRTLTPIASRQPVEVSFRLTESGPDLLARGLVIWTNPLGPRTIRSFPFGMGLAFADFPVEEWAKLSAFVTANLPSGKRSVP